MVARSPRAVRRCHSATSLPTPSPSAFTCVVSATRRPGASTAATASAARARSGGTETPFVVMLIKDKRKASRRDVAKRASRDGVNAALGCGPRPDERDEVRACPRDFQGPAYRERVLLQQKPAGQFHRDEEAGDPYVAGHVDRVREGMRVRTQDALRRLTLRHQDGDERIHTRC